MAEAMRRLGHQPLIAGYYKSVDYLYPNIDVYHINLPSVFHRNTATKFVAALESLRRIKKNYGEFDIIHFRSYFHAAIFARFSKHPAVVLTTPGNVYERIQRGISYFDFMTREAYKWAVTTASRRCRYVITHSQEQRDWWLFTGTSPLRMQTIPLGVDLDLYHPVPDARQKLGVDENSTIIMYVGRLLVEIKGLDYLLEAFKKIYSQQPNAHLYFVGEGPDRYLIEQWAQEHHLESAIHITGWIYGNLELYYNIADVCVMPSRSEPFSRVLLESMACGTPFIGSYHGGMVDHIENNENGFLVNPADVDTLAETILHVITNRTERQRIVDNALRKIRDEFSWETIMERIIENVYLPILESK